MGRSEPFFASVVGGTVHEVDLLIQRIGPETIRKDSPRRDGGERSINLRCFGRRRYHSLPEMVHRSTSERVRSREYEPDVPHDCDGRNEEPRVDPSWGSVHGGFRRSRCRFEHLLLFVLRSRSRDEVEGRKRRKTRVARSINFGFLARVPGGGGMTCQPSFCSVRLRYDMTRCTLSKALA